MHSFNTKSRIVVWVVANVGTCIGPAVGHTGSLVGLPGLGKTRINSRKKRPILCPPSSKEPVWTTCPPLSEMPPVWREEGRLSVGKRQSSGVYGEQTSMVPEVWWPNGEVVRLLFRDRCAARPPSPVARWLSPHAGKPSSTQGLHTCTRGHTTPLCEVTKHDPLQGVHQSTQRRPTSGESRFKWAASPWATSPALLSTVPRVFGVTLQ